MSDAAATDDVFDPAERMLCPDDACIGVLDRSGQCKVCGRQGTPAEAGAQAEPDSSESDALASPSPVAADPVTSESDAATAAESGAAAAPAEDGDDFANRRLCTDPSCIGVLDASDRCKECGRTADPAP